MNFHYQELLLYHNNQSHLKIYPMNLKFILSKFFKIYLDYDIVSDHIGSLKLLFKKINQLPRLYLSNLSIQLKIKFFIP